jgi:hypothetical protein
MVQPLQRITVLRPISENRLDVASVPKSNEMMSPAAYEVDVPVWENGDSWTYNIRSNEYRYTQNGTLWGVWYNNCTATIEVTDDTGDNYTMKMTSKNIEGMITLGSFRLKFTPFTKFTWEMIFRKTDLADCSQFFPGKRISGLVDWEHRYSHSRDVQKDVGICLYAWSYYSTVSIDCRNTRHTPGIFLYV